MKRLIKFLLIVAVLAAVASQLRRHLVPTPARPTTEPPRFRVSAETPSAPNVTDDGAGDAEAEDDRAAETSAPATADDLTQVKGIGPVYASRLAEVGITTFAALAAADADTIATVADVAGAAAVDWVDQARSLTS